ncbi:FHA domain-containing protein [Singulisphaera sp. Ch08]|uniref:FHA domain-containing protein n=1 Tax=Singulisphaera sp. Ch08 TaxID=3120278 RepID=UPI003872AC1E
MICGRHPDADLELRNGQVSRRHCYVQTVGGRLFSVDLRPRTDVCLDGSTSRAGWIDGSGEMRLGSVGLRMRGGDGRVHAPVPEWPSPLSESYAEAHPLPAVTLEIENGGSHVPSWSMSRVMVLIGRSPACQLRLHSPLVSDFHCSLLRTGSGLWLIDLLSQGGVYVDGVATRVAHLAEGAEVCIGPFTIRIRYDESGSNLAAVERCGMSDQRSNLSAQEDEPGRLVSVPSCGEPVAPVPDRLRQVLIMSRAVAAMHREHRDAMDEELRELRGLADELRGMRNELASRRPDTHEAATQVEFDSEFGDLEPVQFDWRNELEFSLRYPTGETSPSMSEGTAFVDSYPYGRVSEHRSRADNARRPQRDPQVLHAIASEFLSAYRLEGQSLREKLARILLRPHDPAVDVIRSSR